MAKINTAKFVIDLIVTDPQTGNDVNVSMFKHEQSGGMFGIDASFIEQNFDDDDVPTVADPFNNDSIVELQF